MIIVKTYEVVPRKKNYEVKLCNLEFISKTNLVKTANEPSWGSATLIKKQAQNQSYSSLITTKF